jgi:hypothetical protein
MTPSIVRNVVRMPKKREKQVRSRISYMTSEQLERFLEAARRRRRENRRRTRSRHQEQGEVSSASCVRVRRKRDYGNRAKSEDQITMGTVGACRKKGYAIHSRRPVRGCGSGRESDLVPQTGPREGRDGYGSPRRRGEPLMRHLTRGAAFFRGD